MDCTVFAPPVIAPGQMIQVQVYAYRPEQGANAASRAPAPAGFRRLEIDVERGAELRFRLEAPGLVVDQPAQRLIWAGSPMSAQFGVAAPGTIAGGAVSGTMRVDLDTVPIGIIEFKLDVLASSGAGSPAPSEPRGDVAYPFRKTFVSYATSDRIEVRRRVQMLAQLQIAVFWDVLNLDPQERWEKGLHHHIDECDLFLVFWSSAARRSEWVLKEVRYALERARKDAFGRPDVRPVLLEGPPFVEPPPDLTHLHFDDGLRYFAR